MKKDFAKPINHKEPTKFIQFIKNWGKFIFLIIFFILAGAEYNEFR